jgi:hypothetical protein
MPRVVVGTEEEANWELLESLHWDHFLTSLSSAKSSPLVIVEGFILFAHEDVAPQCDALITIKYDEFELPVALDRRVMRAFGVHPPPDYREKLYESGAHFLSMFFETVIWPAAWAHPEYIDPPGWDRPRLVLRATGSLKQNKDEALRFVRECFPGIPGVAPAPPPEPAKATRGCSVC